MCVLKLNAYHLVIYILEGPFSTFIQYTYLLYNLILFVNHSTFVYTVCVYCIVVLKLMMIDSVYVHIHCQCRDDCSVRVTVLICSLHYRHT